MTTRKRCPFTKGKTYYEKKERYKMRFVEETSDGYYVFKIIGDPEMDELTTKVTSDIAHSYTSYQNYIKSQEKQQVTEPPKMIDM
jgi:hypothetical protein